MNHFSQTSDSITSNDDISDGNLCMDERRLVDGCREGDRQSQRLLFKKYKNTIYNLVTFTLGSYYDRDDIIQQIFIKLFKSLDNFKGLSSLDTWVYRITTKVCIDQLRKKYRKRQLPIKSNSELIEKCHDHQRTNPFKEQEIKELNKQIYTGLNKLSIEKRLVVTMYEMEGFSLQQIAEIIEKPLGTVKSRLFHGRKELAQHLRCYLE